MSNASGSKRAKEPNEGGEDRISQLSDDIIITCILPLLPLKEGTRTAILSRRWRYLCTRLTSLDFDDSVTWNECDQGTKDFFKEAPKYISWVNQVLKLHRSPLINEFRVRFGLNDRHTSHIDGWLEFAISRHVNNLELDFTDLVVPTEYCYALTWDVFKGSSIASGMNNLKSLSLKSVNVSGDLLELIMSQFHFLERLLVEKSDNLAFLKVTSSSHRLKHLTISKCYGLVELNVDASNLITFELIGFDDGKESVFPYIIETLVHKRVPSLLKFIIPTRIRGPKDLDYIQEISDPHSLEWKVFHGSPRGSGISSLKSLSLTYVNIEGGLLEWLLSQFHFLEELVVEGSDHLVKLKITSSMWGLKYLEISHCENMEELQIDTVDLISFQLLCCYLGRVILVPDSSSSLLTFVISEKYTSLKLDIDYVQGIANHPTFGECDVMKQSHSGHGITSLKSLDFSGVDVDGQGLEFILSRCTSLEELSVMGSKDLVNLRITKSSSSLKYLAICDCRNMKELEIHSTNLSSFVFGAKCSYAEVANTHVVFASVPSLVEASFFGNYCTSLLPEFKQIRCFSSQLSKLTLAMDMIQYDHIEVPTFDNITHLELIITVGTHKNLLALRYFVESCPLLQECCLQIRWAHNCRHACTVMLEHSENSLEEVSQRLETEEINLPHLTKVTLVGLGASKMHVNCEYSLAMYIVRNAIMLKDFICDTRYPGVKNFNFNESQKREQVDAVHRLARAIPSRVNVVVL